MITAPLTQHHVILTPALPREESESIITNEQEQYFLFYIFPGFETCFGHRIMYKCFLCCLSTIVCTLYI